MKAFRRRQGKELEQQEAKKAFRDFQRTSQGVKGTIIEARQNEIEQRLARLENRSGNHGGGLSATVKVKKRRSPEAEELHALVPLIERQMKASRPNTLMRTVWRTILWTTPSDTRADYLELVATLNAIGVAYPEHVPGDESWFVFLVELLVLAKAGDIAKARASYSRVTPNG